MHLVRLFGTILISIFILLICGQKYENRKHEKNQIHRLATLQCTVTFFEPESGRVTAKVKRWCEMCEKHHTNEYDSIFVHTNSVGIGSLIEIQEVSLRKRGKEERMEYILKSLSDGAAQKAFD